MSAPYFNTFLYTRLSLHPSNMNNDIYKHLKKKLTLLQGKCYKAYGYISKIYKIEEQSSGELIEEDNSASAFYNIKFSCKICIPLKNSFIICEVQSINKSLVHLINGPIHVLIFDTKANINQNNFKFDDKKNVLMAKTGANGDVGVPIVKGTFVKIKVINNKIEPDKIFVLGTMESLATSEEIKESIMMKENDNKKFIDYDEYTTGKSDDTKFDKQEDLISESESESDTESSHDTDSSDE